MTEAAGELLKLGTMPLPMDVQTPTYLCAAAGVARRSTIRRTQILLRWRGPGGEPGVLVVCSSITASVRGPEPGRALGRPTGGGPAGVRADLAGPREPGDDRRVRGRSACCRWFTSSAQGGREAGRGAWACRHFGSRLRYWPRLPASSSAYLLGQCRGGGIAGWRKQLLNAAAGAPLAAARKCAGRTPRCGGTWPRSLDWGRVWLSSIAGAISRSTTLWPGRTACRGASCGLGGQRCPCGSAAAVLERGLRHRASSGPQHEGPWGVPAKTHQRAPWYYFPVLNGHQAFGAVVVLLLKQPARRRRRTWARGGGHPAVVQRDVPRADGDTPSCRQASVVVGLAAAAAAAVRGRTQARVRAGCCSPRHKLVGRRRLLRMAARPALHQRVVGRQPGRVPAGKRL